jgi:hypothetical protein
MVPDRDVPKVETPFIISFPLKYTACSQFGQATRPMLAFNMETREVVFLKDYWRADVGYGEGRRNLRAPGTMGATYGDFCHINGDSLFSPYYMAITFLPN